jgi:hypothetical protein
LVCLFCCRDIGGPILGIYKLLTELNFCHQSDQTGHFAAFQACGLVPDEPGWLGFLHLLEEETDSLHGVSWLTVQLGGSLSLLEKKV